MRWSERQQAMLREMGIRLWARPAPASTTPAGAAEADIAVADRPESSMEAAAPAAAQGTAPTAALIASERVALDPAQLHADWLVVGEAFDSASQSGVAEAQLLDNMLRAIGLSRHEKAPAQRAAFEPAAESSDFSALIDATQPRCIVACGRHAAAALLGSSEPLGALRGRVHVRGNVPVIVTFSLAYLMRHPADKAKAWADLCLAVRTLQDPAH